MSFNKKMLAVILTVAFTFGVCSQAFAAGHYSADPRYAANESTITYGDGAVVKGLQTDSLFVMVNGTIVYDEARLVGRNVYLPIKVIVEELGGVLTDNGKTAKVSYAGMSATITEGSNVIGYNGKYYDVGAPVRRINGSLCFPISGNVRTIYGSIEILTESPYTLPLVSVDLKSNAAPLYIDKAYYRYHIEISVDMSDREYYDMYKDQEWFKELGVTTFLKEYKDALIESAMATRLAYDFSRYYYFTGDYGILVNKYTGEMFIVGDNYIEPFDTADITKIIK